MVPNALKKMIIFSSLEKRRVIEKAVKVRASLTGQTESAIIENALYSTFLPKNYEAAGIAEILYGNDSLASAYDVLFQDLSAGVNWNAKYPNGEALVVEFNRVLWLNSYRFNGTEEELPHLRSQFDSIVNIIKHEKGECQTAEKILSQLVNTPQALELIDLMEIILTNWDVLKNCSRTYRALSDMSCIAKNTLKDTPENRARFVEILSRTSESWD